MYFLLVFGDNVEDFLHPLRYLALIFPVRSSAIAADTRSQIPSIGASGDIAGGIVFLCPQISTCTPRLFDALGLCLVSVDSIARLVRTTALDFVSMHRRLETKDRHQPRFLLGALGRSDCWIHCMGCLATKTFVAAGVSHANEQPARPPRQ
jgi:hypothetical protein